LLLSVETRAAVRTLVVEKLLELATASRDGRSGLSVATWS